MDNFIFMILFLHAIGCASTQNGSLPLKLWSHWNHNWEWNVSFCCSSWSSTSKYTVSWCRETVVLDQVVPILRSRPPCPCGGPGNWTMIAHLDMIDPTQQCPTNWSLVTTPLRGYGRGSASSGVCKSAIFLSNGRSYSRVCGRVNAYQQGTTDGFGPRHWRCSESWTGRSEYLMECSSHMDLQVLFLSTSGPSFQHSMRLTQI